MKNRYYVYYHVDPTDEHKVVYVGHGYRDRAWCLQANTRSIEHILWANELMEFGLLPPDFVEMYMTNMTKAEACELERKVIDQFKPRFNKPQGVSNLKMTNDLLEKARFMREAGFFYHKIAEELGLSTMTIHRALNGKIKNIG